MDINLVREQPELVKESQRRRYKSVLLVDVVRTLDESWRKAVFQVEQLKKELNEIQAQIGAMRKAGKTAEDTAELVAQKTAKENLINKEAPLVEELKKELDRNLFMIGNLVHDTVPVSNNEEKDNVVASTWGELRPNTPDLRHHHELLYMIDGYEPEAGAAIAGHRGYFLKGPGVLLNQAIINYALAFLNKKTYTLLQTPYFMNKAIMAKTAQLADFDEQLFKVSGSEGDDKYLIATSEQPLSALHMDQWIATDQLPKRYAGYSTNFRKEAGGHGRDVWGIFRVHQFEKIEQFCITEPEKSWEMHEEMRKSSEEFYQSLGIPYRVVNIVSGELNDAAAKKYDLEGWFPALNAFRELVSCSNCTDYQSRRLEITTGIRSKDAEGPKKQRQFVHMLNSTLAATTRTICAILENYQTDKGINVPKVLQPYMAGVEFIPFTRELPAEQKVTDAKAPAAKGKAKAAKK